MIRRALIVAAGQDLGGSSIRTKYAFERHSSEWSVTSVHSTDTYIAYPVDVRYRFPVVARLYDDADVVHLHGNFIQYERLDDRQGKPAIMHHHGTEYRRHHATLSADARRLGIAEVASTIDLTLIEPGVSWLPSPYDLEWLAGLRAKFARPDDGRFRIAHAPTNRAIKSTAAIIAAVARLAERGLPVELDVIEGRPWRECLERKARADVFVDQVILGYGNNAIEAFGMGIPTVAGVADPKVRQAMRARWGKFPFVDATEATLEKRLEALIASADLRAEYRGRGLEHAERWHAAERVVAQLTELYGAAKPSRGSRRHRAPTPQTPRQLRREARLADRRGVAGVKG